MNLIDPLYDTLFLRNCEKKDGNQCGKINALKWIKPEESGK
jgi:hypothetical protein